MEVGCEDYDTKPIQISRLLAKIAALLPQCMFVFGEKSGRPQRMIFWR